MRSHELFLKKFLQSKKKYVISVYTRCVPDGKGIMQNVINTILFGKYEIISVLGTGNFSTTYLSKHNLLECYRAIKCLPKQPGMTDSLMKEAQILKSLNHPGIPTIFDIEEDNSNLYLIEEFVEGESLEEFLRHQSHISLHTFLDLSLQLCDIFYYLHTLQPSPILYLDLKPEHIIVCGMKIKLIDFNVSTYLSNLGNIYNFFGNKDFTAPELFSGTNPNLFSDIYSIGKIMDYLSNFIDVSISPKIHQIIQKATHADPACRFETVDQLISAIKKEKSLLHQEHSRKTIAVVGSHPGCGTTHLAIALVSTLNYMGYSAIYYDKSGKTGLQQALDYIPFLKEINGMFFYKYFKGYPFYGPGICMPNFETSISVYDYSDSFSPAHIEADIILYVCSDSFWNWHHAFEKGESLLIYKDSLKIICNMGQKHTMHILSKYFSHPIYYYPYDKNPFFVDPAKCDFVSKLLNLKIKRRNSISFHLKNMFQQRK